jgi:chromosome segregation ATPase
MTGNSSHLDLDLMTEDGVVLRYEAGDNRTMRAVVTIVAGRMVRIIYGAWVSDGFEAVRSLVEEMAATITAQAAKAEEVHLQFTQVDNDRRHYREERNSAQEEVDSLRDLMAGGWDPLTQIRTLQQQAAQRERQIAQLQQQLNTVRGSLDQPVEAAGEASVNEKGEKLDQR